MDQEVDVELFITCRLCLDEPGSYQIVPCIKSQINFCFGIDIDPFDGLPQLICKKCKGKLAEYYSTKNVFVEKQQKLHKKLPKQNNDINSLVPPSTECLPKESPAPVKVTPPADLNPPGDPVQPATPAPDVVADDARKDSLQIKRSSWKKSFNKYFVCTICTKRYSTEKSIKKHSATHKKIISKYKKVFKSYLTVRLNRIDKKNNSTGGLRNVVYNKNKIIEQGKSQYHHSFYLKKDEAGETENVAAKKLRVPPEPSDDEIVKGKRRKTGRLESTSSIQTVILEENKGPNTDNQSNANETEIVNTEYINLDDTSSDFPRNNNEKKRKLPRRRQVNAEVADYKEIQNIVTMCHDTYEKKIQADNHLNKSSFSESSLKHEVLSLGRKVLNKEGFVCTGLLRYMEHKYLFGINWTPTTKDMQKKGSSFVRIMTKLKSREDSENDDTRWKNLHVVSFRRGRCAEAVVATVHDLTSIDQASLQPAQTDEDPLFASATCEANDLNYRNKLLNKTPVANPRQLPNKNNISEAKLVVAADDAAEIPLDSISNGLEDSQVDENNMFLPIIMSTTSLSLNASEQVKQEIPDTETPTPRIKVKPASELMTVSALNNQETVEDIWAFNPIQSGFPHHLINTGISVDSPMIVTADSHSGLATSNIKDEPGQSLEQIVLDSPQFPNTKTMAPFQYFRKVLLVHGLQLLDLNEDLPDHFSCLIRFRLMLKQGSKRPIAVLLSLFCSKDTFCFSFKDSLYKQFDPNDLPAFWQWELLKIYKTDIGDKILHNALKVGKEAYNYTSLFLCLLKSINLVKEE